MRKFPFAEKVNSASPSLFFRVFEIIFGRVGARLHSFFSLSPPQKPPSESPRLSSGVSDSPRAFPPFKAQRFPARSRAPIRTPANFPPRSIRPFSAPAKRPGAHASNKSRRRFPPPLTRILKTSVPAANFRKRATAAGRFSPKFQTDPSETQKVF